jgi:hypothetical protein
MPRAIEEDTTGYQRRRHGLIKEDATGLSKKMPRAFPVESHACRYASNKKYGLDATALRRGSRSQLI